MEFVKSIPRARITLLAGLCLLLVAWMVPMTGYAMGVVYERYVDADLGTDNNDPSQGESPGEGAWKTLHFAISMINAFLTNPIDSCTLYVASASVPYGSINNGGYESENALEVTVDNLTIVGALPDRPVIDGRYAGNWPNGLQIGNDTVSASNVVIRNLVLQNFTAYNSGIKIVSGYNNIVENCEIRNNDYGIHILSSSYGNAIRNGCSIHDNYQVGIYVEGSDGNLIHDNNLYDNGWDPYYGYGGEIGIHVQSEYYGGESPDFNKIYNNSFYWTQNAISSLVGIQFSRDDWIFTGDGNEIYENVMHGPVGNTIYHTAIHIYSGSKNTKILKNKIYNLYRAIFLHSADPEAVPMIVNNLIYSVQYGITLMSYYVSVYHNTVADGLQTGIEILDGSPEIKYNIISGFDQYGIYKDASATGIPVIDYNDVWNNVTNYYGCSAGFGNISDDPEYTAAYDLLSTSPCINAILTGDPVSEDIDGTLRPQGDGFDMGSYEYVFQSPTITSFTPTSGGKGTTITITGTNFTGTEVKFGGTDATSFTVDSFTKITAIVGNGSTGRVTVTTAEGIGTSDIDFNYTPVIPGTFYVDSQNGDDSFDGLSQAHAWKTLHHAFDQINGGSAGAYTLNVALGTYGAANGEANAPLILSQSTVTILGASGSAPLIDGTGLAAWTTGMEITGSIVTLQNLHITGFSDMDEIGIESNTGYGNTISNCWIYGNYDAVRVFQSNNFTITGCEIFQNANDGISIDDSAGGRITQNTIHSNSGAYSDGIIVEGCSPEVSRNTLFDNAFNISIVADNSETASPTIKNNLIYEVTTAAVSFGIAISGNDTSTVSPKIYHNSMDGGQYEGILIEKYGSSVINPEIKYNIISRFRQYGIQNSGGNSIIDYNDVWNNGAVASDNYKNCIAGLNDISLPPLFQNYQLQACSPCIDTIETGDPVTDDFIGTSRPQGPKKDMGAYEYIYQAPVINEFSPTSGTTGTIVTISGDYFCGASGVTFGGTSASGFSVDSDTQISATIGAGSTGEVKVTTPGGTFAIPGFTFSNPTPPSVMSFTPTSGGPGTTVTITGTNFTGTEVKFGGTNAASFTVDSSTQITAVVGNGRTGKVSVTTAEGTGTSNDDFIYTPVPAGTYYVDIANGNDADDGSAANPWKTLHYALQQINGGSTGGYTLNVAAGIYRVPAEPDTELVLSQNDVTIYGASRTGTIINGTGAANWTKGLEIIGSSNVVMNLSVTGFSSQYPDPDEEGIRISGGTMNEVTGCSVYGNNFGIRIASSTDSKVQGCEIFQNSTHGMDIIFSSGTTVVQNVIHSNPIFGIRVESSPDISRNEIYDNGVGILVEARNSYDVSPFIINNVIYEKTSGSMDFGIFIGSYSTPSVEPEIYHNTIDGGSDTGIKIAMGSSTATPLIKYNIITNFSRYGIENVGSPGNPIIDYNDVWNNGDGTKASNYLGCEPGANDLYGTILGDGIGKNPLYVSGSYQLQRTSPCIDAILPDAGDPVTIDYPGYDRPRGNGWDIGAYEYIGPEGFYYTPHVGNEFSDYRIFTVPLKMRTGADLLSNMILHNPLLFPYNPSTWRAFLFKGGENIEFNDDRFPLLPVGPGVAFWIITLRPDTIRFQGEPAPTNIPYEIVLPPGWSLIGLPWISTPFPIYLENIKVTDGVNTYDITDPNNDLTQTCVWDYTGSGPYNGYEKRLAGSTLQCGVGYFINVNKNVTLIISPENPAYRVMPQSDTELQEMERRSDDTPPPPPGGAEEFTPVPDIKANGQDGPVDIALGEPVSITITLDPGEQKGRNADWWVLLHTSNAPPSDWYSYVFRSEWQPGIHLAAQAPLFMLRRPFEILDDVLPSGDYVFYFGVDDNADGRVDGTSYDSVEVRVQ